ncbi:DNA polymerase II large subunit [Candidatus Woesearchaeota archaeon CG10_big_fil_rev_8_21_14_0_10_30_7]|nr:MAG: DNA polymerase II large subunit [Candidatus Woesearchaeota archaeon CG10_big_fil_rev_8_21_14_0_10_30_7]
MNASPKIQKYFEQLQKQVKTEYFIASESRKHNLDPEPFVEMELANNMAELVVGLISVVAPQIKNKGIEKRILNLEEQYGLLDWRVSFTIALEVAQENFCNFENKQEAIETGIRIGFAYVTLGVVSSPLDGFIGLEVKKRMDNRGDYFCLNFAGPIRNAGGTGASVCVLIADYIRKKMNYDVYDAQEKEIKRAITELQDYHERITNLQYFPSPTETEFLIKNIPVEIGGDPSEKFEVSNFKDLPRIQTNLLRSGYCLILSSCIPLKAPKIWKQLSGWGKDFDMEQWNFLEEFLKIQKQSKAKSSEKKSSEKISPDYTYINDLVAGRPVLGDPLTQGGFRLRYGRSRVSGYSSQSIHPATKLILNSYIAVGTQLKVERPGKATSLTSCDLIEGPTVKLHNGDVIKLNSIKQAKKYSKEIHKILFLGDILISYGDFFDRAHPLVPAGYCEEWWVQEFKNKLSENLNETTQLLQIEQEILQKFLEKPLINRPTIEHALIISEKLKIPLHPKYTYHWDLLNEDELKQLLSWFEKANFVEEQKVVLPLKEEKIILEKIGLPHSIIQKDFVVINYPESIIIKKLFFNNKTPYTNQTVLEYLEQNSGLIIRKKSGTFIGARMGRPEKAKIRKLTGSPHMLFPVGDEGGKFRSIQSCLEKGKVTSNFAQYFCKKCNKTVVLQVCEYCESHTEKQYSCKVCGNTKEEKCKQEKHYLAVRKQIKIQDIFSAALKKLKMASYPDLIKGVRGTTNKKHIPENIAKGILRAKHDIYVNKDGTTRYDMTQLPITHFKPLEINTPVKKLRELGYEQDIHGKPLLQLDQVVELFPQDVILPACEEAIEDGADKVLFKLANFIDNLLVSFYEQKSFYNLKTEQDLIGHLVIALAPHTSVGTIGRIIGFSKTQGFFAHPLLHAATRRDCFTKETKIPLEINGIWKNVNIGDFVESLNPDQLVDSFGTKIKKVNNVFTLAYNFQTKKIDKFPIKWFSKHTPQIIKEVILENGRSIKTTTSHKFLVTENGKFVKKSASELKCGDKIPVPFDINLPSKKITEINFAEYYKENNDLFVRQINKKHLKLLKKQRKTLCKKLNIKEHSFFNFQNRDSYPISLIKQTKINLNEVRIGFKRNFLLYNSTIKPGKDLLEIIGLYVAEGFTRKNTSRNGFFQTSIASKDPKIKNKVKKVFKKYFKLTPTEDYEDKVTFSSRLTYDFFTNILKCGHNAKTKKIPELILNSSKEQLAAFLRGYFEGDGSTDTNELRVSCDTVSSQLIFDLEIALAKFGIYVRKYSYAKQPGPQVRNFYLRKNREIPTFQITKLTIPSNFCHKFAEQINFLSERKKNTLRKNLRRKIKGTKICYDKSFAYLKIKEIKSCNEETSYCLNVPNTNTVIANGMLTAQCDGDESCVLLLMDAFLNFSRNFLPDSRGGTMDAPLVLRSVIIPGEVDDMVFHLDIAWQYPLELYEKAQDYAMPWEVKIPLLQKHLGTPDQYENMGFTHDVTNLNTSVLCSAYKTLPTMQEKLLGQMDLAEKINAVNTSNVARLVIEKHFLRDLKGNLRKFSSQVFRCVNCNEKYRRPPLIGRCIECHGKIIFTISEGGIVKYLEPTISLAKKYNLDPYLVQTIDLLQQRIEGVFGKDKEKQLGLGAWFG